jgi:alkanesulfonate monooxygenase SsuD/methylene tetrahydromethanopterin reductase-like flavin-dependent oxidoreductase (luciferase family)
MIAAYLNVPVYAAFHDWLGRGELLAPMWQKWEAGDRKGATEAIPDEVIDQLVVNGTPEECREHLQRYVDNGITTPAPAIIGGAEDARRLVRALAPNA